MRQLNVLSTIDRKATLTTNSFPSLQQLQPTFRQSQDTRYKTLVCKHYLQNACTLGDLCNFAHSISELRKPDDPMPTITPRSSHNVQIRNFKTVSCKYFESGFCKNADSCSFAHGEIDRLAPVIQQVEYSSTNSTSETTKLTQPNSDLQIQEQNSFKTTSDIITISSTSQQVATIFDASLAPLLNHATQQNQSFQQSITSIFDTQFENQSPNRKTRIIQPYLDSMSVFPRGLSSHNLIQNRLEDHDENEQSTIQMIHEIFNAPSIILTFGNNNSPSVAKKESADHEERLLLKELSDFYLNPNNTNPLNAPSDYSFDTLQMVPVVITEPTSPKHESLAVRALESPQYI